MKTTLSRKPANLEAAMRDCEEIRSRCNGKDTVDYYVAEEKHLDASEWNSLVHNFLKDRDWIAAFTAEEYEDDVEEGIGVLRVTGNGSEIALLIDPSGYSYARYVGIERTPESSAGGETAQRSKNPGDAIIEGTSIAWRETEASESGSIIRETYRTIAAAHEAYANVKAACARTDALECDSTEAQMQPYWAAENEAFKSADSAAKAV